MSSHPKIFVVINCCVQYLKKCSANKAIVGLNYACMPKYLLIFLLVIPANY